MEKAEFTLRVDAIEALWWSTEGEGNLYLALESAARFALEEQDPDLYNRIIDTYWDSEIQLAGFSYIVTLSEGEPLKEPNDTPWAQDEQFSIGH